MSNGYTNGSGAEVPTAPAKKTNGKFNHAMSLAMATTLNIQDSPTARLISVLDKLKSIAAGAGHKPKDLVLANIGDITGVPELPLMKEARTSATTIFNAASNCNGYPPYPGLPQLRQATAEDLMRRLGFADQSKDSLIKAGILKPGQELLDLVAIGAGSVGCSGSICSHVKYHQMKRGKSSDKLVSVGLDRTHYWKHQGVAEDFGRVKIYDFMVCREERKNDGLHLDAAEALRFGREGGGIMVLNFANPLCFLPSAEDAENFVSAVFEWNLANSDAEITVCVDGPYDDFDGADGYRFVSLLMKAGVTTSYIHARTKEEFATGGRGGEVLCNNPAVRQLFNAYKADYIGSDSKLEQEIALHLHNSAARDEQKLMRNKVIRERKEFFWDQLQHSALEAIREDTRAFYRPSGPFYVFLNVKSLIETGKFVDSMAVCVAMAKLGVILVPGTLFDENPESATGLNRIGIRISFGAFDNKLWEDQINKLVMALTKLTE